MSPKKAAAAARKLSLINRFLKSFCDSEKYALSKIKVPAATAAAAKPK